MDQGERRTYLIRKLLNEKPECANTNIPSDITEQRELLRSLMNVRMPKEISEEFIDIQNKYLQQLNEKRGIVTIDQMDQLEKGIFLWKGDITKLKVGAIVNAANSGMTGCYQPCHNCIDNCIHTYAGIQLRNYCDEIIRKQGHEEPTGSAKITPAFNLPCDYVIHTVGPIIKWKLNEFQEEQLRSCYESCLKIAEKNNVESIAFCCISTGVFGFPNDKAAEIAIDTVRQYRKKANMKMQVIFNVFKEEDEQLYRHLFSEIVENERKNELGEYNHNRSKRLRDIFKFIKNKIMEV